MPAGEISNNSPLVRGNQLNLKNLLAVRQIIVLPAEFFFTGKSRTGYRCAFTDIARPAGEIIITKNDVPPS
jgi:hypothetical protein